MFAASNGFAVSFCPVFAVLRFHFQHFSAYDKGEENIKADSGCAHLFGCRFQAFQMQVLK